MKKHRVLSAILSLALVLSTTFSGTIFASTGDGGAQVTPPATKKTLAANGDGTYTLSLSVTGRAESTSESGKADVIVVLDRSGSMEEESKGFVKNPTGRYGLRDNRYVGLYYWDGKYKELKSDSYGGTVYYRTRNWLYGYTYTEYTGDRYASVNTTRLAVAKSAVNSLAEQLLANNTVENPDTVRLALVSFAGTATVHTFGGSSRWTMNQDSYRSAVNNIEADGGTNWEAALQAANALETREGAEAYVIFVSDGNPTFYGVDSGAPYGTGGEGEENVAKCYEHAKDDAKAIVAAGKHFYGIGVFGNVDRMKSLVRDAGAPAGNYYSATDSAGLRAAFTDIIGRITNALGYKNVKIEDGITGMTSSLVKAEPDSFTYVRSGGSYGDGQSWTPENAQKAQYADGKVSWDLGDMQLENGVTYTVSFVVWPSQQAYDLVADLNNGSIKYDELNDEVKSQLTPLLSGGYGLNTNTTAKMTYTQIETRTSSTEPDGFVEGQPANDGYTYTYDAETGLYVGSKETDAEAPITNPDPMPLTSSLITIVKKWDDNLDNPQRPERVELVLVRDKGAENAAETSVVLSANSWSTQIYIAPGLIAGGAVRETGHTYEVTEPNIDVRYELSAGSFRPMLVDGELVANYSPDSSSQGGITITATNVRKGDLAITKNVIAEEGLTPNPEATFTIKVTFERDGQAWLPAKGDQVTYTISNGESTTQAIAFPDDGIIHLKDGEKAVISNLPTGVTYDIGEENLPGGFALDKKQSTGLSGTMVRGEIKDAIVTNVYKVAPVTDVRIPVTKVLEIPSGLEGPAAEGDGITGRYTFTLAATTEDAPMPAATAVTNPDAKGGTAYFGPITYTEPGTYEYTITESGTVDGVINDKNAAKSVSVIITDKGNGTLAAVVGGATPTNAEPANTTFTNTYAASSVKVRIPVIKVLSIPKGLVGTESIKEAYEFTFVM